MFASRFPFEIPSNPLINLLNEKKDRGDTIIDLTESNPTKIGFDYSEKEILSALSQPQVMQYNPSPQGILSAREAIAGYYQKHCSKVDPSAIFLTASTSEAYAYLFKLLADPGDEVLIPRPSYPLFELLAGLESVRTVEYPLKYHNNGWHIDLKTLSNSISNKTKAIIIVSPNNPTGSYLKDTELKVVNQICNDHNCALIVDEVFLDYASRTQDHQIVSASLNNSSLTFTLSGFSKVLALPQLKMAWIVMSGPEQLINEAKNRLEFIADTYLSVSAMIQVASGSLFSLQSSIQRQLINRVEENEQFLRNIFGSMQYCSLLVREGGWYAVAQIKKNISDEDIANRLLNYDDVYIHPGYFYNFTTDDYIVISLLPEQSLFQTGINRLYKRLEP